MFNDSLKGNQIGYMTSSWEDSESSLVTDDESIDRTNLYLILTWVNESKYTKI